MPLNTIPLTKAHWRQLPPAFRAQLRRRLGGKAASLNRPVLDVARTLCDRGAYDLAFDLYRALDGEPLTPYQGQSSSELPLRWCGVKPTLPKIHQVDQHPGPHGAS